MNDIALSPVETASADEVRALQDRKLRRQMAYLKAHSPFAAAKLAQAGAGFEDIRSVDDLAGLPFTTKQELRDSQRLHPPFGSHAAATREQIVRVHASSGTTGVPSYIPVTAHDSALWREAIRRVFRCQGVRPDSTVAMGLQHRLLRGRASRSRRGSRISARRSYPSAPGRPTGCSIRSR